MTNEVREALREIESHAEDSGDGGWFETLVRTHGPAIRHWNVDAVHKWDKWPARTTVFPDSSPEDITTDCVAEDAAGKRLIAIQCKARREGSAITLEEVHGFLSAAGAPEFEEAWIVGTTGPSEELREHLNNRGLTKVRCLRLQDELLQSARAADDADPVKGEQGNACMVAALVLTVAVLVQTRLEGTAAKIKTIPASVTGTERRRCPTAPRGTAEPPRQGRWSFDPRRRGDSVALVYPPSKAWSLTQPAAIERHALGDGGLDADRTGDQRGRSRPPWRLQPGDLHPGMVCDARPAVAGSRGQRETGGCSSPGDDVFDRLAPSPGYYRALPG